MLNRQKKFNSPLRLILIFCLLVIGITASGYVLYESQKAEFKEHEYKDLSSIADLKVQEISNWRKERLGDAHVVQQNLPAIQRIRQFLENPSSGETRQELLSWMEALRESYHYGSVVLLDTKKQVRLYWGDETRLVGGHTAALAEEAMRTQQIIFTNIHWGQVKHAIRLDIFIPLLTAHGGHEKIPTGVLLLRSDLHRTLYPIVQFWPTSSPTAETLLVRREGDEVLFLNDLRHKKDAALTLRMPISEKQLPAAMAVRGEEGIVEGMDYRGIPVLAAIKAVPDTPWYIIAKIDTGEVFAPLRERFLIVFILVCALIVLAGTATGLIWRNQRARLYRRQYEAELEREALTRHYEYLTKYANDIILMMDEGWKIIEANDRAVHAYGHTYDELLHLNIREIYDPEVISFLSGWMEQVDTGNGLVYETVHRRKDGTTFPVEISARTMMVEGKKFYQAIIRDITERKRAEEALKESAEKYQRFFMTSRDCVFITSREGSWIDMNDAAVEFFGYSSREELMQVKIPDLYADPEERTQHAGVIAERGYSKEFPVDLLKKDGTVIHTLITAVALCDAEKNVTGFQGTIRDITELKDAEESLRQAEAEYRSIFENAQEGIFQTTPEGRFITVNKAMANMLGYDSPRELFSAVTDIPRQIYVNPEDRESLKQMMKEYGPVKGFETQHYRKDGSKIWVSLNIDRVCDAEGNVSYYEGMIEDITERKQAEELHTLDEARMESLLKISQYESESIQDLLDLALNEAITLTGSTIGYIYFYDDQTKEFTLNTWSRDVMKECAIAEPQTIYQLEKTGIWGEAVRQARPIVVNDFQAPHPLKKGYPEGHAPLHKYLTVPVFSADHIVAVAAVANKKTDYDESDVRQLTLLMDSVWKIAGKKRVEEALRIAFVKRQELEFIVSQSPAVVWLWKALEGWPVEYVSDNVTLYGYTPDDFTSGRIAYASIVHPDDLARLAAEVEQYTNEGRTEFHQEYRIFAKSGDIHWIDDRTWVRRGPDRSVTHYQGVAIDITKRRQAEAESIQSFERLRKALGATVQAMAVTVERRDPYTAGHQRRVSDLARTIATEMELTAEQIDGLRMASVIHDIGKISVPAEILSKPTKLNDIEFSLIKIHSQAGYDILKDIEFPWPIARIVLEHHERIDGSGYPNGLTGEKILIESQVLAVADVVEAIASHRPYRPGMGIDTALDEIAKNKGVIYNPKAVDACLKLFREKGYKFET